MDSFTYNFLVYSFDWSHRNLHVNNTLLSSDGKIHDFAGSYYISIDDMAFGEPHKYVYLNPDLKQEGCWDEGIINADNQFKQEEHNLIMYFQII